MKGQGDGLATGLGLGHYFTKKSLSLIIYKDSRMYGGLGLGLLRVKWPYGVWRNPTARPSAKQRNKKR